MNNELIMHGDAVFYTGQKFKDRLHGKRGWIHSSVLNQEGVYVVEFPDTRNPKDQEDTDDYVMSAQVLTKRNPAPDKKAEGPEVQPRRRRRNEAEET